MRRSSVALSRAAWALAATAALVIGSQAASAELIAGWAFSQPAGPGVLRVGGTPVDQLGSNYAAAIPDNTGPNAQGTAFFDGSFGSTPGGAVRAVPSLPGTATSLGYVESNVSAPVEGPGDNPFNSFTLLRSKGQQNANLYGLSAIAAVDVVFQGNAAGSDWSFSFGGRTFGDSASVSIAYDADCDGGFVPASGSPVLLDATDQAFDLPLTASAATSMCVRVGLDGSAAQPVIDNVAIEAVPEPSVWLGLFGGSVLLSRLARARARATHRLRVAI